MFNCNRNPPFAKPPFADCSSSRARSEHDSAAASTAAPSSDVESYHIHTDAEEDVWLLTEGSDWVGSDDAAMGDL